MHTVLLVVSLLLLLLVVTSLELELRSAPGAAAAVAAAALAPVTALDEGVARGVLAVAGIGASRSAWPMDRLLSSLSARCRDGAVELSLAKHGDGTATKKWSSASFGDTTLTLFTLLPPQPLLLLLLFLILLV